MFSIKSLIVRNEKTFLMFFGILLFFSFNILAQTAGTWEGSLKKINSTAWGDYIKPAVQIGLFIWFAIKVIMIFVQRDKEHNWWEMLMILMGVIVCQYVGDLYFVITGQQPLK